MGSIRVIKLVIPPTTSATPPAPASNIPVATVATVAPAQAQTSPSVYGGQTLPGGTIPIEDFTAQYALDGGQGREQRKADRDAS